MGFLRKLINCIFFRPVENKHDDSSSSLHNSTHHSGTQQINDQVGDQEVSNMVRDQVSGQVRIQNSGYSEGTKKLERKWVSTKTMKIGLAIALDLERNCNIVFARKIKLQEKDSFVAIPCQKINASESHETQQKLLFLQSRIVLDLKCCHQNLKTEVENFEEKFKLSLLQFNSCIQDLSTNKFLKKNSQPQYDLQKYRGDIRVYCRIKPILIKQKTLKFSTHCVGKRDILIIENPTKAGKQGGCKMFSFNKIFGPFATHGDIFSDMQPLMKSILDGVNVCIFAYGQTGSGKTYSMSGPSTFCEQTCGLSFKAIKELFELCLVKSNSVSCQVLIQMIEVYNEQVRDLLATNSSKRVDIHDSSLQNGVHTATSARLVPVKSVSDAISLINIGDKKRVVASTTQNDRSSRSHRVLTIYVEGISGSLLHGCLHLVDLAGSERIDKVNTTGKRLKETIQINKSLSTLKDVFTALVHKNSHVPYRNNMLTRILKDSLGGQAEVVMLSHVNMEESSYSETISTLNFSDCVSMVQLGSRHLKEHEKHSRFHEQI